MTRYIFLNKSRRIKIIRSIFDAFTFHAKKLVNADIDSVIQGNKSKQIPEFEG